MIGFLNFFFTNLHFHGGYIIIFKSVNNFIFIIIIRELIGVGTMAAVRTDKESFTAKCPPNCSQCKVICPSDCAECKVICPPECLCKVPSKKDKTMRLIFNAVGILLAVIATYMIVSTDTKLYIVFWVCYSILRRLMLKSKQQEKKKTA